MKWRKTKPGGIVERPFRPGDPEDIGGVIIHRKTPQTEAEAYAQTLQAQCDALEDALRDLGYAFLAAVTDTGKQIRNVLRRKP